MAADQQAGNPDDAGRGGAARFPARYEALHRYLLQAPGDSVELTVAELDALVAGGLPDNAREHLHEWWSNNPRHAYARAWVTAGWQVTSGVTHPTTYQVRTMRFERAERPPVDLVQLQRDRSLRERWATSAGERKPDEVHVKQGWHLPHLVYQVHLPDQQRFKVGLSRVGARRSAVVGAGRSLMVVEAVELPDRFQAELVEIAVLWLTDPWRILFPEHHAAGGYTEMWSDDGPTVDLAVIAAELSGAREFARALRQTATAQGWNPSTDSHRLPLPAGGEVPLRRSQLGEPRTQGNVAAALRRGGLHMARTPAPSRAGGSRSWRRDAGPADGGQPDQGETAYAATMELELAGPLDERTLDALIEAVGPDHGAIAVGASGPDGAATIRLILDVRSTDVGAAAVAAVARTEQVCRAVGAPDGKVASLEVITVTEQERRLAISPIPELLGVAEVAEVADMLGVSRQRFAVMRRGLDFPEPLLELASGPLWTGLSLARHVPRSSNGTGKRTDRARST